MTQPRVSVQTNDFDLGAEVAALRAGDAGVGAVAAFVGTVRDRNDGSGVSSMELEHYPGMTEKAIESMIDEAQRLIDLIHREKIRVFFAHVPAHFGVINPDAQDPPSLAPGP